MVGMGLFKKGKILFGEQEVSDHKLTQILLDSFKKNKDHVDVSINDDFLNFLNNKGTQAQKVTKKGTVII